MPSTEEQVKNIISQHQGKVHKRQIARELKIGLEYTNFICQSLSQKGEIVFSGGWCSLPMLKHKKRVVKQPKLARKISSSRAKPGKRALPKKKFVIKKISSLAKQPKKRAVKKKPETKPACHRINKPATSQTSKPGKSPKFSLDILGASKELIKIAEKAGYKTIESLAKAPFVRFMQETKLKVHEAAGLINQARKILSKKIKGE